MNYPQCDFACWDDPLPDQKCPKCNNTYITLKKGKKGEPSFKFCVMCEHEELLGEKDVLTLEN